jgi:hypothetical protein
MTHSFEGAVEQVRLSSNCRCPSLRRTDIHRHGLHHGGHLGLSPIHGLGRGLERGAAHGIFMIMCIFSNPNSSTKIMAY